jgi:IQ motif/SEC7 domain-containing protein
MLYENLVHKHPLILGQRVDKSLRNLLSHVRVPGEAQKIERIMEEFGRHYYSCNSKKSHSTNLGQTNCGMNVSKLKSPDSIITLAFAIMMLNTDLHTPNIKGIFQ